MTELLERYTRELRMLGPGPDEDSHWRADNILCEVLLAADQSAEMAELVSAYRAMFKWYA